MKCIGMMLSVAGVLVWSLGAFGSSARILSVDCQGEISGGQVTARVVVTNLSDKSLSVSVSGTILDHAVGKESLDVGAKVVDGNDCNALNARKAAAGGVVISGYKAKLRPRAVRTITISETVESPKPLPTSYDMNLTLYDANGPCDSRTVSFAFEKGVAGDYNRDFTTGTAGSVSSAACGVQCAAVAKSEMQSAVQKILDDAVASGAQSACQCCVYIDGKLVVDAWAGTMATNSAEKIDGSSLFPIFSTEKAQFVTAVHIAHERGKFDYEAKIRDYWPEFRGGNKDELTVRQLLGMRTGLPGAAPREFTDAQQCDWKFMQKPKIPNP